MIGFLLVHSQGSFFTRITHDETESQIEDNLIEVQDILLALNHFAQALTEAIESDNRKIPALGDETEMCLNRIRKANEKATAILNS